MRFLARLEHRDPLYAQALFVDVAGVAPGTPFAATNGLVLAFGF